MQRRTLFLQTSALAAFALLAPTACGAPPTRQEVLEHLVLDVAVPDTRATLKASEQLSKAVSALAATPTLTSLGFARAAFDQALLAWKRIQCFKNGPLVETNALVRATFWPPRPTAIEALLNGTDTIDRARIDALRVDVKGLYALEYVLFPAGLAEDSALALLSSEPGQRRLRYADALAKSIVEYIRTAVEQLGNGSVFAQRFAHNVKQSLSTVVVQLTTTVEGLAVNRLGAVLTLADSHLLKPSDIEGAPSQCSAQLAAAELEGVARLYRGQGRKTLSALVHAVSAPVDDRVLSTLADAERALGAMKSPLEVLVVKNRDQVQRALALVKALELALKDDLASALGIARTFRAADGD